MSSNTNNQKRLHKAINRFYNNLETSQEYIDSHSASLEPRAKVLLDPMWYAEENIYHGVDSLNYYIDVQLDTRGRKRHHAVVRRQQIVKGLARLARTRTFA